MRRQIRFYKNNNWNAFDWWDGKSIPIPKVNDIVILRGREYVVKSKTFHRSKDTIYVHIQVELR